MENFEEILKTELGIFRKEFQEFRTDMKGEMTDFKEEMNNFRTDVKDEINDLKDEVRNRFFVFEQEYGTKIDAMYDIIALNKETTDQKIEEIEKELKITDNRSIMNSSQIDSLKKVLTPKQSKKLNSII